MRASFRNFCALLAFALVFTGCAIAPSQPLTFADRLANAAALEKSIVQATDDSLVNGQIDSGTAIYIRTQANIGKLALDAADTAYAAGDQAGADSKLAIALAGLKELQDYLRGQGAKP